MTTHADTANVTRGVCEAVPCPGSDIRMPKPPVTHSSQHRQLSPARELQTSRGTLPSPSENSFAPSGLDEARRLGLVEDLGETSATGRLPWVIAAGVAVILLPALLVLICPLRWFPGVGDCAVSVNDRAVELDTAEAETAASVAARSVRLKRRLPTVVTAIARAVDISETDARVVATALTGRASHAFTCVHGGGDDEMSEKLGPAGLTARADRARRDLERAFGPQKLGGFAPGGVTSGHMPGSAHYEGRAVDAFFRPVNERNRTKGWAVAQYLVAHADRLAVETVIYDGRIWTARRAGAGWRSYRPDTSRRSAEAAAILEHLDHVHVDVAD